MYQENKYFILRVSQELRDTVIFDIVNYSKLRRMIQRYMGVSP